MNSVNFIGKYMILILTEISRFWQFGDIRIWELADLSSETKKSTKRRQRHKMLRPVRRTFLPLCGKSYSLSVTSLRPIVSLSSSSPTPTPIRSAQFRSFTSSAPPNADRLTWDEFLRLRRQRRLTGVLASIPTSAAGVYIGLEYFGSGDIDPTQMILGFDPFMMNAAFVLGCGIFGWLVGPTIGRAIWHLLHRRKTHLIGLVRFFVRLELTGSANRSFISTSRRIEPIPRFNHIAILFQTITVFLDYELS
jgi:hypothetical protein